MSQGNSTNTDESGSWELVTKYSQQSLSKGGDRWEVNRNVYQSNVHTLGVTMDTTTKKVEKFDLEKVNMEIADYFQKIDTNVHGGNPQSIKQYIEPLSNRLAAVTLWKAGQVLREQLPTLESGEFTPDKVVDILHDSAYQLAFSRS